MSLNEYPPRDVVSRSHFACSKSSLIPVRPSANLPDTAAWLLSSSLVSCLCTCSRSLYDLISSQSLPILIIIHHCHSHSYIASTSRRSHNLHYCHFAWKNSFAPAFHCPLVPPCSYAHTHAVVRRVMVACRVYLLANSVHSVRTTTTPQPSHHNLFKYLHRVVVVWTELDEGCGHCITIHIK